MVYLKLLEDGGGTVGSRMPMALSYLTEEEVAVVRDWIASGAGEGALLARLMRIWDSYQCDDCHRDMGRTTAEVQASLLAGERDGYAYVVPGSPEESLLYLKLLPSPPMGSQMPIWFPYLSEAAIQDIETWILEGAIP